ncbi:hypothetical protein D3C75_1278500 [compost metagenome]
MLAHHVVGFVKRAGEHQLPVQRQRLALERHDVQGLRVVDHAQATLWSQHFNQLRKVLISMGKAGDMAD